MEPGTPQPKFTIDGAPVTLAWNERSTALISKQGYGYWTLLQALRGRGTGFYALCVALYAAVPPALTPAAPEDAAAWLKPEGAQQSAIEGILALWKHYYVPPAEKKSASKRSSPGRAR